MMGRSTSFLGVAVSDRAIACAPGLRDFLRQPSEQKVPPASFTEVGHGSLDFPAILRAAQAAGVAHYYVEQDHSPGDPVASLRQSYEYLRTLA